METDYKYIPLKSINLTSVAKRREKIMESTRAHYSMSPTGEDFEAFVQDVYSCFPLTIRYDVVFASLMNLAGKKLTPEVIRAAAWRLAGNMNKLKIGEPVPEWVRQTTLEWCPVNIKRANPGRGYDGKFGFFYEYDILAGTPAGLRFNKFWSMKYIRFIARELGFKKTRKAHYRLLDGHELVGMRLYLLFDPVISKDDKPIAYHFAVPNSCKVFNTRLLELRYRIVPCPEGYSLEEVPCHNCPFGYDKCSAGCHPKTYEVRTCFRCGQDKWHDPLSKSLLCIECIQKVKINA